MGWVIALAIIAAYVAIGLKLIPFFYRESVRKHKEYKCGGYDSICRRNDEDSYRECAAWGASWVWTMWPIAVAVAVNLPRSIAAGAMAKDKVDAARLKELEAEAAVREAAVQRELVILRAGDPLTMSKADFDRKMNEAGVPPKPVSKFDAVLREYQGKFLSRKA